MTQVSGTLSSNIKCLKCGISTTKTWLDINDGTFTLRCLCND